MQFFDKDIFSISQETISVDSSGAVEKEEASNDIVVDSQGAVTKEDELDDVSEILEIASSLIVLVMSLLDLSPNTLLTKLTAELNAFTHIHILQKFFESDSIDI